MAEPSSLNSILDDETSSPEVPAAEAPPPAEAPKAEAPKEQAPPQREPTRKEQWRQKEADAQAEGKGLARDPETGQFVKKEEPAAPPPPKEEAAAPPPQAAPVAPPSQPEMTEKERAYLRAAQDERHKRQELEAELAKLRQPQQQPGEQPKGFWDDPEGAIAKAREDIRGELLNVRLSTAEQLARSKYQDFDQNIERFAKILDQTPGLHAQWLASPDPAEFAYKIGKNHVLLEQAGSIDAITEKVRKETEVAVRAKVEAEFKAKQEALERERAALPPSLTESRGTSTPQRAQWNGPTPLENILEP
jgi:hypothetical protein